MVGDDTGEPDSPFGYVVDGLPEGYALCAITTPSALSLSVDESAVLQVYGAAGGDDPYAGPLYGVAVFEAGALDALPLGETLDVEVDGRPARLGAIDGFQLAALPERAGRTLTWVLDDGRAVQLVVRNDDSVDLVELAGGVVVDGDRVRLDGLTGFDDLGDLYELEGRPQFRFSLDHQRQGAAAGTFGDQLTLLGSAGDAASMEAFRFRAAESERTTVGDAPAVGADIGSTGEGPWVISWLAEDDLILRLFSFELRPDELADVATTVRRVDGSTWDELRGDFDPSRCEL